MSQMPFAEFGYIVESCPRNKTEYLNSATRLSCGMDENGRSQYVCVPDQYRSNLVEFCYDSTIGLYEKGNCIEVYENGNLDQTSCLHFADGCPSNHFFLSDLYNFPACHEINLQERCFIADPVCPNSTNLSDTDKNINNGNLSTEAVAGITVIIICVIIAIIVVILILMKRRKASSEDVQHSIDNELEVEGLMSIKSQTDVRIPFDVQHSIDNELEVEGLMSMKSPTDVRIPFEQPMDFPITLFFESKDISDILDVLKSINDFYPKSSDDSFAYHLLPLLQIEAFKSTLKSLESRVILVDPNSIETRIAGDGCVCVCRVEVRSSNGQLTVHELDDSIAKFGGDLHLPKAFLVSSNAVSVSDAKLAVNRKYKNMIENGEIRIFHESVSNKEFLRYCAKCTIDSLQDQVENLMKSIPIQNLHEIVTKAANIAFSNKEIKKGCQDVDIVSDGQNIGSVRDGCYPCRSPFTIKRIKETLISKTIERVGQELTYNVLSDIIKYIQNMLEVQPLRQVKKINISKDITCNTIGTTEVGALLVGIVLRFLSPLLGMIMTLATVGSILLTISQETDVNSVEWRDRIANEIYEKISARKAEIINDVHMKMISICEKTVLELREFNEKLASASRGIQDDDQ